MANEASSESQEPVVFPVGSAARGKIDEWLAGIEATRDGTFTVFFIHTSEDRGIQVTPENADEVEADIREHFAPHYPELIEAAS